MKELIRKKWLKKSSVCLIISLRVPWKYWLLIRLSSECKVKNDSTMPLSLKRWMVVCVNCCKIKESWMRSKLSFGLKNWLNATSFFTKLRFFTETSSQKTCCVKKLETRLSSKLLISGAQEVPKLLKAWKPWLLEKEVERTFLHNSKSMDHIPRKLTYMPLVVCCSSFCLDHGRNRSNSDKFSFSLANLIK